MKQVTASVYAEDQFSVPPKFRGCNPSFVTTSEGIVMIDTPFMPTDALKWRNEIKKRGEVRYIINTDHHIDHSTGNFFFPGTVVAHEKARANFTVPPGQNPTSGQSTIETIHLRIKEHDPPEAALIDENYRPKPPTITFSERLSLYLGNHTFEMFYLPGHTEASLGVYLLPDKVFFSGDNVCGKTQPSLASSLILDWVKSLKKIEALDIDFIVPGHGEICDLREARRFRLFLQKCLDMVREAIKKGMTKEQAAKSLSFEDLRPGKGRGLAVHPGPEQQRRNVLRLYEVLSK